MPATLITTSAMATRARTAVISLTRSGVRRGSDRMVPQKPADLDVPCMQKRYDDGSLST